MIRINVAEIKKRLVGSKTFAYELTPDELDITDTDLKVTAPIQLEGVVENAGGVILLKADVKTEIERTCGRCLKVFTEPLAAQVVEKLAGAENIENDAFIYESDLLDITEPVRESLLLAVPLQSLCREDCRGLCPVCGADRNEGDCGCDATTVDPRLAALKQFIKN